MTAVVAVMVVLSVGIYAAADSNGGAGGGFGNKLAGSYLGSIDGALPVLLTVGADGTVATTDGTDFGLGIKGFGFESPAHGSWAQTGRRDVSVVLLWVNYDETGALTSIGRTDLVAEVAHDYSGFTATGTPKLYAPGTDPLDPDTEPMEVLPDITVVGRRIEA
jgi:hypothetical protein